jgi:hypothetical protein
MINLSALLMKPKAGAVGGWQIKPNDCGNNAFVAIMSPLDRAVGLSRFPQV